MPLSAAREREKASAEDLPFLQTSSKMSAYFWRSFSLGVTPWNKPTVPKAEPYQKIFHK